MTQTNINAMDLVVSKMENGKTLSKALQEVYNKRNVIIPYREEWLDCQIISLKMSMRATGALLRNKLTTIRDVVNYTETNSITSLATFGRLSGIELFEAILDYCWSHMSKNERTNFLIDTIERNSGYIRAEIEL